MGVGRGLGRLLRSAITLKTVSWGSRRVAALAAELELIDRSTLNSNDRVALLQARQRLLSHVQAELYSDMAVVGDAVAEAIGELDIEFQADEVRAALVLTRRAAETQMDLARSLVDCYPQILSALRSGLLDVPRVRVIVDSLVGLETEAATRVVENVLPVAPEMTTGQLRAYLAKLIIASDPDGAADRYREKVKGRRLWAQPSADGTADLFGLELPADRVARAMALIHKMAQSVKTADDPRTADQVRADVFLDLLCGEATSTESRRGTVDVRVDLTTLAGLDDKPGEIPGWGPVISDIARQLVDEQPKARWQVTVTGTEGEVVWTGTTRRRPDTAMRRYVVAKRTTCVFPGCRMPAQQSDLDHNQAWSKGGTTDPWNLAPLCRHDHCLKHRGKWKLQQIRPGVWLWTSPLGRKYQVGPAPP